jgi:hypothetical protein
MKSTSVYGRCNHHARLIELSAPFARTVDAVEVMDVMLHEIAHALTPEER